MNQELKKYIRSIKDFPKQGIMFRDITTLLKDPVGLNLAFNELYNNFKGLKIDKVVGIESRGFILGGMLASKFNCGFVPARKPKKLPAAVVSESYSLEYGIDSLEMHKDAILPGEKVLIHDDLLATGGTVEAVIKLVEKLGGEVVGIAFLIELTFLNGRKKLEKYNVKTLIEYEDEN